MYTENVEFDEFLQDDHIKCLAVSDRVVLLVPQFLSISCSAVCAVVKTSSYLSPDD